LNGVNNHRRIFTLRQRYRDIDGGPGVIDRQRGAGSIDRGTWWVTRDSRSLPTRV